MKIEAEKLCVYAVTERKWLNQGETLGTVVEQLILGGVSLVQLREKNLPRECIIREALELKELCHRYEALLIINDDPEIAKLSGADGVHVGLEDMEIRRARALLGDGCIIGASAHNVAEARRAEAEGADYIGCGAVFGSTTKKNVTSLSIPELKAICASVSIPVVAIGGITKDNVTQLAGTGIAGTALVSALFAAGDPKAAAQEMKRLIRGCR